MSGALCFPTCQPGCDCDDAVLIEHGVLIEHAGPPPPNTEFTDMLEPDPSNPLLTTLEVKALAALDDLLNQSGAEYATEAQWRQHAEGRGARMRFKLPDMIDKSAVEEITIVCRQPRYGADIKPMRAYRPR
jgi:hypothetical protein